MYLQFQLRSNIVAGRNRESLKGRTMCKELDMNVYLK